jgi:hypothetical protein
MAKIPNLNLISQEVKDKYSIVSNAFKLDNIVNAELDTYKNEPKDETNVIVGDDKQVDFLPQVKLCRWTNEVNFSVRLKDEDTINTATVTTVGDKIVWDKGNIKIENYDFTEDEGGYKFVWYLKSKPVSNKVEFTIQSKGLDFFYQPELTAEEIAQGASRPENVVGSYAVYHQTKGGMNDCAGKEYKAGKAFHIYRPKIIDAVGKETWGNLHIENGIYSVEIPQDFLDKAVYPIKSNDTFGYLTVGSLSGTFSKDTINGYRFTGVNGTLSSLSRYLKNSTSTTGYYVQLAIYKQSDLSRVDYTSSIALSTTASWHTGNVSASITAIDYFLVGNTDTNDGPVLYYDTGVTDYQLYKTSSTFGTWPNPISSPGYATYKFSIYATYTASGGVTNKFLSLMGCGT